MTLSNLFKCTIESDSSWLHLMVGTPNQLVSLKGKKSGDPTVPARGLSSGTTGKVRPTLLACLAPARISRELPNHESRALPRVTRDKVRRRFTLSATALTWWDDRAGTDVTGGPDCCR